LEIPRWGRWVLWRRSYSRRACSRCAWFHTSVRSSSSWRPVQQRGEEGPIRRGKPRSFALQLSFEDGDLVAQREDLGVFGPGR
jgi:hypothetical protein